MGGKRGKGSAQGDRHEEDGHSAGGPGLRGPDADRRPAWFRGGDRVRHARPAGRAGGGVRVHPPGGDGLSAGQAPGAVPRRGGAVRAHDPAAAGWIPLGGDDAGADDGHGRCRRHHRLGRAQRRAADRVCRESGGEHDVGAHGRLVPRTLGAPGGAIRGGTVGRRAAAPAVHAQERGLAQGDGLGDSGILPRPPLSAAAGAAGGRRRWLGD